MIKTFENSLDETVPWPVDDPATKQDIVIIERDRRWGSSKPGTDGGNDSEMDG